MNGYSTRSLWMRIAAIIGILIVLFLLLLGSGLIVPARAQTMILDTYYTTPVEIGTTTNISVRCLDVNLTLTDDVLTFSTTSQTGFYNGSAYVPSLTVSTVGGFGNVTFLPDRLGANYVIITATGSVPPNTIVIYTQNTAPPAKIESVVVPYSEPVPWVYADGLVEHRFTITYAAYDARGYPTLGRKITVASNVPGDITTVTTNQFGVVVVTFGPKVISGRYTITATAVDNSSATISNDVDFVSTDAVNMILTASPQTMPSREVDPSMFSSVVAKVYDARGNPVLGEPVDFVILGFTNGTIIQTVPPTLEGQPAGVSVQKQTDATGEAIISFIPGAFTTNLYSPGYTRTATGTATIQATWNGVIRQINVEYKNYPYISISTVANPIIVGKNEYVDVTLRLKGDGFAFLPNPIDVYMVTDRSGSMLKDNPDRMVRVMDASKVFAAQFDYSRDRMGQVSFGTGGTANIMNYGNHIWSGRDDRTSDDYSYKMAHYVADPKGYGSYATIDLGLSNDPAVVNTTIMGIVPDSGTPMRYALYRGINDLGTNGRTNAIRAVVVLSDGDYNWYGDPLARGSVGSTSPTSYNDLDSRYYQFSGITNQSMAGFAIDNHVRIYSIAFATDISSGGRNTLQQLAQQTGGKYFYAPDASSLAMIYTEIAGDLKTTAGVDTQAYVDMSTVVLNNQTVPGSTVFSYKYVDGISTYIHSWNETHDIIPAHTEDQTAQWVQNKSLQFSIGTVHLGQIWEAKYRLVMDSIAGTVNLFGPSAYITFDDGSSLKIPDTYITIIDKSENQGSGYGDLFVSNLTQTGEIPAFTTLTMNWNIEYKGNSSVMQRFLIEAQPGQWFELWQYHAKVSGTGPNTGLVNATFLTGVYPEDDIWACGGSCPERTGTFNCKIEASADDGGYSETFGTVHLWDNNLPKIKLT